MKYQSCDTWKSSPDKSSTNKCLSCETTARRNVSTEYRWHNETIAFSDQSAFLFHSNQRLDSTRVWNAQRRLNLERSLLSIGTNGKPLSRLYVNMHALCVYVLRFPKIYKQKYKFRHRKWYFYARFVNVHSSTSFAISSLYIYFPVTVE